MRDMPTGDQPLLPYTPKQTAIILSRVLDPEIDESELAEKFDAAPSYPASVLKREDVPKIINEMRNEIDQGNPVKEVLIKYAGMPSLREIAFDGTWEEIPIDSTYRDMFPEDDITSFRSSDR